MACIKWRNIIFYAPTAFAKVTSHFRVLQPAADGQPQAEGAPPPEPRPDDLLGINRLIGARAVAACERVRAVCVQTCACVAGRLFCVCACMHCACVPCAACHVCASMHACVAVPDPEDLGRAWCSVCAQACMRACACHVRVPCACEQSCVAPPVRDGLGRCVMCGGVWQAVRARADAPPFRSPHLPATPSPPLRAGLSWIPPTPGFRSAESGPAHTRARPPCHTRPHPSRPRRAL
jgi:hypothetical protein